MKHYSCLTIGALFMHLKAKYKGAHCRGWLVAFSTAITHNPPPLNRYLRFSAGRQNTSSAPSKPEPTLKQFGAQAAVQTPLDQAGN
jgi:hypothetical protein